MRRTRRNVYAWLYWAPGLEVVGFAFLCSDKQHFELSDLMSVIRSFKY